jgi:hypothetical protein
MPPIAAPRRPTSPVVLTIAILIAVMAAWSTWDAYSKSQLPVLPMVVESRPAIIGSGKVIVFENQSDAPLSVAATLSHPATNVTKVYQIDTPAHGSKSIESLEGWADQTGDTVTLVNNNYQHWNGSLQ